MDNGPRDILEASWRVSGSDGGGGCANCAALAAEVVMLEEQVAELEQELQQIQQFCDDVISRAQPTLSKAGGVPRGQWSRLKGRVDVAEQIAGALG